MTLCHSDTNSGAAMTCLQSQSSLGAYPAPNFCVLQTGALPPWLYHCRSRSTEGKGPKSPHKPLVVAIVMVSPRCLSPPPALSIGGEGWKDRQGRKTGTFCASLPDTWLSSRVAICSPLRGGREVGGTEVFSCSWRERPSLWFCTVNDCYWIHDKVQGL